MSDRAAQQHPSPARVRVAMLVLNSCHSDARVLKEASALGRAGHDVRIFAVSDAQHPAGVSSVDGATLVRLEAASPLVEVARGLSALRRRLRAAQRAAARPAASRAAAPTLLGRGPLRRLLLSVHRPSVYLRYWRVAGAAVAQWQPDVVHAHDLNALPPAAGAAARLAIPLVYDSHELWRHRNRHGEWRPLGRLVDAAVERHFVRRCSAVLTVSDSIATWLQRTYRLQAPVTVVRNVPELGRPMAAPSLRELTGLPTERLLLYTGRILPARGLEEAIGALALLPTDVHLVMLGYGDRPIVARLERLAEHHGVGGRLHRVGPVPVDQVTTVAREASAALVAIQPTCLSYRYALPNKLFEAVHAGVPVIASDLPDLRATVERHGVGECAVLDTPRAVAAAVEQVLAAPERYRKSALAAAGTLCWEVEQQRLLDVYAGLAAPRAVSRQVA